MGLFGGGASPPDAGAVASQYNLQLYYLMNALPGIYKKSAQFEPMFAALQNQITSGTRAAGVKDVAKLSPQIMKTMRGYNPGVTSLLDTLTNQAQAQLTLNGGLDPATKRNVEQSTRSAQAARGLGYGPGDAAQEQFYTTQTQEARRQANQAFAGQVAGEDAGYYGDPFSKLLGYSQPVSSTSSIVDPNNSSNLLGNAESMVGTAQAANYNTNTARTNQLISTGTQLGSLAGAGAASALGL